MQSPIGITSRPVTALEMRNNYIRKRERCKKVCIIKKSYEIKTNYKKNICRPGYICHVKCFGADCFL